MMIMSSADSTFFSLDEVATVIWLAADGHTPLSDIARKISEQYDVSQAQAKLDAEQFVDDLSQHGILMVFDSPIANSAAQAQP